MSPISRLPLPSISLVLTTDHTCIPRRPSVVQVAPLYAPPTKLDAAQFNPMKTIHSRDVAPQLFEEQRHSQEKYDQSPHIVFIEEVDTNDFTLAESIQEDRCNEHASVGKAVKRKVTRALMSFRQVLCVELPYTRFRRALKQ